MQSLRLQFNILGPETVFGYLPVSRNLPKSSLNLTNTYKSWIGQKSLSKAKLYLAFFQAWKMPEELKKVINYKFGLKKPN